MYNYRTQWQTGQWTYLNVLKLFGIMMFALLLLKITEPKLLTEQSCVMLVQVDDESKCLSNSKLKYVPLIISYMYKNLATRPFSSDVISLGQLNYSFNETAPRGLWPLLLLLRNFTQNFVCLHGAKEVNTPNLRHQPSNKLYPIRQKRVSFHCC